MSRPMRPPLAIALAIVSSAALWAPTGAAGAVGDLTFSSCASDTGSGGGCLDLPGSVLDGPGSVAVHPDSSSIYVTASDSDSIDHLFATPGGGLAFSGCDSNFGSAGLCTDLPGSTFNTPGSAVVSPNGASLYLSSFLDDAVGHLFLGAQGAQTYDGCVSDAGSGGLCANVPGAAFDSPSGIAVSPNSASVYVASAVSDSVTHFSAPPQGQITFAGCVSNDGSGGACADVPGAPLDFASEVAVSPSGGSVYVLSGSSDSITRFTTNSGGGITFADCISDSGSGGTCSTAPAGVMDVPSALEVSPDGSSVYLTSTGADTLARFSANSAGQLSFGDCVSNTGAAGACVDLPGATFDFPDALTVSRDGRSVYASASTSNSLTQFGVSPTGALTFARCFSNEGSGGACVDVPGTPLNGISDVATSPDGGSVYATARASDTLVRFLREPPPPPPDADSRPPSLTLNARKGQAGKTVKVEVSCDEACTVSIDGTAKPKGGRGGKLRGADIALAAGGSAVAGLRPKKGLKRALKSAGKGRATITATAIDAAGNAADASDTAKLK